MSAPVRFAIVLAFGAAVSTVIILLAWPFTRGPEVVALGVAGAVVAGQLVEDRLAGRRRRPGLAAAAGAVALVTAWAASAYLIR